MYIDPMFKLTVMACVELGGCLPIRSPCGVETSVYQVYEPGVQPTTGCLF